MNLDLDRRALLLAAAAGIVLGATASANPASASSDPPAAHASDAPAPAKGTGKAGEFAFLTGSWKIANRRLKAGAWDEFPGEATCWGILGGVGSIEELRIPARDFSGMGLRLLDLENGIWNDFWVNGKSGVLGAAGLQGTFVDGAGIFLADDVDGEQPIKIRGVWDRITPTSCRWHQAVSRDAGKTWEINWSMDWTRVA